MRKIKHIIIYIIIIFFHTFNNESTEGLFAGSNSKQDFINSLNTKLHRLGSSKGSGTPWVPTKNMALSLLWQLGECGLQSSNNEIPNDHTSVG